MIDLADDYVHGCQLLNSMQRRDVIKTSGKVQEKKTELYHHFTFLRFKLTPSCS